MAESVIKPDVVVDLTEVPGDGPAAILLVNLHDKTIVYANKVAQQLAPSVGLPAAIDDWALAADLRTLVGDELTETDHPLSRIAQAQPVAGQAVSAARSTDLGQIRDPMWVVALPLSGATQLEGHGLVAFFPFANRTQAQDAGVAADAESELRHRAVLATGMSFTVADARDSDVPLIWVNPAFTATTGYTFEESVGRNCRFLQGPATDPDAHLEMRRAIEASEAIDMTLLNYRKDGTAFWNQVSMNPIFDPAGELTHYVGIQTDVTGRILSDQERNKALAVAQEARAKAEKAEGQVAFLAEATSQLAESLRVDQILDRLGRLAYQSLGDEVYVALYSSDDQLAYSNVWPERYSSDTDAKVLQLENIAKEAPSAYQAFQNMAAELSVKVPASEFDNTHFVSNEDKSILAVPLRARGRIDGILALVRTKSAGSFDDREIDIITDLARRAALILDNARVYQVEHEIAQTLQHSLLPEIPQVEGISISVDYLASSEGAYVGGDFYDVIPFKNGSLGLAVGDVVGHDIRAAAAMGHLRGLLRACAWSESQAEHDVSLPGEVLDCVDELVRGLNMSILATIAYFCLRPNDGSWLLDYSNAGHLPLMLRRSNGEVEILDDAEGLMIGVDDSQHASIHRQIKPGDFVIAYTDGLVERPNKSLAQSIKDLAALIEIGPADANKLKKFIIENTDQNRFDDVALMIVGVG